MASSAGSTSPSSHAAAGKALASSGRPTGTAIMRLCDELEAVRSAWKQEGAQLRARIVSAVQRRARIEMLGWRPTT